MRDEDFVAFLQWAMPQMGLRWAGFRKVRGQVRKRVARRIAELSLTGLEEYRDWLKTHPEEWSVLDAACRISITRFYRDRAIWQFLESHLRAPEVRGWSAGCAAGEEPYTLAILLRLAGRRYSILGTDTDAHQIERAWKACYPAGSLRDLPPAWREAAFEPKGCLRAEFRAGVRFLLQDIRREMPEGPFDLILCRNLVFTYFAEDIQLEIASRLASRLAPGGFLVAGMHETAPGFKRLAPGIFQPA
ncbi:MAG TPA: CheR family methyltransferase [Bryobacteraceae bacterium]|nr:CheR family methyltransferase [Bryobacteraceae bacterium]HOL70422.1 CheR family methyltransferase [Bryobacteraceae bacterium]HOQ46618.1 CheR family methyltransferase [Bryobacteraceae bacterium]HPQ15108.1 CheR family methyltransferase [Bryobacteraceae bacterium]HPU74251.1 CheR family methyltransferase [Bryobacteraceae bacterium]